MKKTGLLIALIFLTSYARKSDVDILNENIAHLREVKMELEEENFELKQTVEKDKKAVDSLTKAITPLQAEVKALKKANQEQQVEVAKVGTLEKEVASLKAKNEQDAQKATALLQQKDAQIKQDQATIESLKTQVLALQTENSTLQGGASAGKNDIAQLKVQVMQLTTERDQLKAALAQAQQQAASTPTQVVSAPQQSSSQPAPTPQQAAPSNKPFAKSDIQVQLVKKELTNENTMKITLNFKNNSSKTINEMKAQIKLVQNSRFLMNVDIDFEDVITSGGIEAWSGTTSFDANHPGHQMLLSASPSDVVIFLKIKSVTFADGSSF